MPALSRPKGASPGSSRSSSGDSASSSAARTTRTASYIRNMDGSVRPEPEMLDETCPECGRQLQKRVGRFGPFVGCSGYPDCRYIKKDPPRTLGITCPQCEEGEIVEKRTRFGVFFGCDRYPDCDFGVNNEPIKDHPCSECGSLLVQRPKSIRCWNCGAEFDLEFNLTKEGDAEAEAEARAAKAAARAARAAAKKKKSPPRNRRRGNPRRGRRPPRRPRRRGSPPPPDRARRPRRPGRASLRCRRSPTRSPPSAGPSRRPSRIC